MFTVPWGFLRIMRCALLAALVLMPVLSIASADPGGQDAPDDILSAATIAPGSYSATLDLGDSDWYRITHGPTQGVEVTIRAELPDRDAIDAVVYADDGSFRDVARATDYRRSDSTTAAGGGAVRIGIMYYDDYWNKRTAAQAYEVTFAVVELPDLAVRDLAVEKVLAGTDLGPSPVPGPIRQVSFRVTSEGTATGIGAVYVKARTTGDGVVHEICDFDVALAPGAGEPFTCDWDSTNTIGEAEIRVTICSCQYELDKENNEAIGTTFAWVDGVPGRTITADTVVGALEDALP